ncbi:MAG: hypothetical protein M3N30_12525 [Bacteroidota bacterium]|nr:hypothetical protein [Bacteroidota bacterium]
MVFEHSLLAFKQDIEHRGLLDWLEVHTSFMRPLHRYYGTLEVNHESLLFSGTDERVGSSYVLVIKLSKINCIHLGYDSTFMRIEDRSLGIFHFVPLRIDFMMEGKEESIYVFPNYSGLIRHSDNQKLFDELNTIRGLQTPLTFPE